MSSYCVKRIYVVTSHLVVAFRVANAIQLKEVLNQLMHKFILDTITDQHFDCVRCMSSEERKLTSIRQVRVLWYARDVLLPLHKRAMRFIKSSEVQKLVDPYFKNFEFSRSTACVSLVPCFHLKKSGAVLVSEGTSMDTQFVVHRSCISKTQKRFSTTTTNLFNKLPEECDI